MSDDISNVTSRQTNVGSVKRTTETSSTSKGVSGAGLYDELLLLIAQGNGLLNAAVQTQQNVAMKLQQKLSKMIDLENEMMAVIPKDGGKHHERYMPAALTAFFYNNDLLPSHGAYVREVKNYMGTNPDPVQQNGSKHHRIKKVKLSTFMVFKQILDNEISKQSNAVSKQATTLTSLSNAVNSKLNLLTSTEQNQGAAGQKIASGLKPLK